MHHEPVFLQEVLELLPLRPGALIVDGTLGLGGHSIEIIKQISPGGTLVGLDWDGEMLAEAGRRIGAPDAVAIELVNVDYREIGEVLDGRKADGILLDLGLNNAQIEDSQRGISFRQEGPLDMRMDRNAGEPASALLNRLTANQIENILRNNADEKWARRIAQIIVETRREKPLKTTTDLVDCVLRAIPVGARDKRIHAATRTFQAIRIEVNRELEGLEEAVTDAAECLAPDGVLVALSYHSGEDRAVKHAMKDLATKNFTELFKKPRVPSDDEISRNPKSRSAKLRAIRRLAS